MEWILFLILAVFFVLGFLLMDKLDKFIASPNFITGLHSSDQKKGKSINALVFGNQDISDEIIDLLGKHNISYEKVTEFRQLNKSTAYHYLFAVDENDFENLMTCSFCERMMGIEKRIAICNCFDNMKIFKENHIPYLCGYSVSAPAIVAELIPSVEADGGNPDVKN